MAQPTARAPWTLDPGIVFLNHGSFGACPAPVLAVQQAFRDELERNPMEFLARRNEELVDVAREALAAFVGADPDGLVFVNNPTAGVNTVLRSLQLAPDDEIVVTDHGYNACTNAAKAVTRVCGAKVVTAAIPFPIDSPETVVERVLAAVGPKTKLALIDHVTSPTGLVLPVERLARELETRGVDLLVDGAHAPGMVPLDIAALDVPYYTGHCHKWVCAPKGAAFLHLRADRREGVQPLSISHGANSRRTDRSRLKLEFDWTGTHDPTAWFSVPAALECMASQLPGGWPAVMDSNKAKVLAARARLCEVLGTPEPAPPEMIGSLATVILPDDPEPRGLDPLQAAPLQAALWQQHAIEVPVPCWPGPPHRVLRISAQLYNTPADYETLATALPQLLAAEAAAAAAS